MASFPSTFLEAVQYFSDAENCIQFLAGRRWKDGITCPTCGRKDAAYVPSRRYWQCKTRHPKAQFSVKTGTILEESPISLEKWLPVIWLISGCKNGISSYEVARDLGVTQKTAWFMLHRIRLAMQDAEHGGGKLSGEIEADESFIGGKARNMHKEVRARKINGTGPEGKAIVAAVLQRGGKVRAKVMPTRRKNDLHAMVRSNVETGANLYTDALKSYEGLDSDFVHQVIDHAEAYVNGQVHTNGLENFWSLLKRGINGTYVSVEPFHLFRYVDEQAWRYNNRKDADGEPITDAQRFELLCSQIVGKRLTYDQLIAKEAKERAEADF